MQPYLLGFCETKDSGLTRSVLTAVARVGPHRTLFATCKHAITQPDRLFITDENGVTMGSTWGFMPTVTPDLDLAFLFIRQDVPADRIRINESPIARDTVLSHGRNRIGQTETPCPFSYYSAAARHSPYRAQFGHSIQYGGMGYEFLKTKGDIDQARREGMRTCYSVLQMESWPGVSGSALWDKFGVIRGMVCGGDSAETRIENEVALLVYLPAKILRREVGLILKDPVLRVRMHAD